MKRLTQSNGKMLRIIVIAAVIVLSMPTPALAEDWGLMVPEIVIPPTARIVGAYSLAVLIASLFRVFRSQTALNVAHVLSAIVSIMSIPALAGAAFKLKSLLENISSPLYRGLLAELVLIATLICFVWAVPMIQHRRLNRS